MLARSLRTKQRLAAPVIPTRPIAHFVYRRQFHVQQLVHPVVLTTSQQSEAPADHTGSLASGILPPQRAARLTPSHLPAKPGLPTTCPGCGSLAQEVTSTEPGFYTRSRKAVRAYLKPRRLIHDDLPNATDEGKHPDEILQRDASYAPNSVTENTPIPICDRCHDLLYNLRGVPVAHPSLEDIADSIAESPFSRNHVYHVLDAADFPMSLEPRIMSRLSLAKPRSQNRRSQTSYSNKPTLSFIITRSDLLAPTKEKVDGLMPYFQSVLRAALGRAGENIRLGNISLVSAKRGWWTKNIKEDIWKRGGGNWMVGKFNVGKSSLFEVLFPKGSGERAPGDIESANAQIMSTVPAQPEILSESSLLPPAQPEVSFPTLPLVSNLPGTTASPIRIPFGNHRGELIDLPGLDRGNLSDFVLPEHKLDLVMTQRPKVSQHTMKPGQSLLLGGGVVRITPLLNTQDPSTTMMAYPFVPLTSHVTSTEKAMGEQQQSRDSGIESVLAKDVGEEFQSAGRFTLDTDVTRHYAGPLLRAGISLNRLPFRVYSTDLLIQGVGWIELVCQIRRRRANTAISHHQQSGTADDTGKGRRNSNEEHADSGTFKPYAATLEASTAISVEAPEFPVVEVFTPQGKHIGQRKPLGAWNLWREGNPKLSKTASSSRPRRSMKGVKKQAKAAISQD